MKLIMICSEYQIDLDEKNSQYWANMAFSLQREGNQNKLRNIMKKH